jgi:hypothetical protein
VCGKQNEANEATTENEVEFDTKRAMKEADGRTDGQKSEADNSSN